MIFQYIFHMHIYIPEHYSYIKNLKKKKKKILIKKKKKKKKKS